jgi:hypothetical protein
MDGEIEIRKCTPEDLDAVAGLESQIWPEGTRAPRDKFASRLEVFPEGFFLAYNGDELIGASTSEIINYDPANPPISWELITNDGYITNTHNPTGNGLYVVSIGAISRSGGGSALLQAQKGLVKELGLTSLVLGARIPGYNRYCLDQRDLPIDEYAKLERPDTQLLDSELRFYTRNGLQILKTVANYMENDSESRNYGAIMTWENSLSQ